MHTGPKRQLSIDNAVRRARRTTNTGRIARSRLDHSYVKFTSPMFQSNPSGGGQLPCRRRGATDSPERFLGVAAHGKVERTPLVGRLGVISS